MSDTNGTGRGRFSRRGVLAGVGGAALAAGILGPMTVAEAGDDTGTAGRAGRSKPTILLVHGAFADGSSWSGVTRILQRAGHPVVAAPNPLRGLRHDSAYVRAILATLPGPVVVVGHSYGGAVITNAAAGAANVKALVYVAAIVPDEGETLGALQERFPRSELNQNIKPVPTVNPDGTPGVDLYVDRARFAELFAGDVPRDIATAMGAAQRPASAAVLGEPSGPSAWKQFPSRYVVTTADRAIEPEAQRAMAQRSGSRIVELRASHAAMVSRPDAVARVIRDAARSS